MITEVLASDLNQHYLLQTFGHLTPNEVIYELLLHGLRWFDDFSRLKNQKYFPQSGHPLALGRRSIRL
jgi:hypothetical protein